MKLLSLGYAGVGSRDITDWKHVGAEIVGLQCVDVTSTKLGFRMDDRKRRILVDGEMEEGVCFFGWEVANADDLRFMADRLDRAGVAIQTGSPGLADSRFVQGLISFADPAGNRHEIFHGPHIATEPFSPGRNMSGFRTGALGLGHAVLTAPDIDAVGAFFIDVLGFRVSDYISAPFKACFLHINARHHSLALIQSASAGVHHLMLEMYSLDDVGQAFDLAEKDDQVSVSLGRHSNDFMTSFYTKTPSPFLIECGWGGREIDPDNWEPVECTEGPSLWGHERKWLSAEGREVAREMRMHAAAQGFRQPVQVLEGNHHKMSDLCPWINTQIQRHAAKG